jgi:hypothetical protein
MGLFLELISSTFNRPSTPPRPFTSIKAEANRLLMAEARA